jgi:lactoylglutathione lyase
MVEISSLVLFASDLDATVGFYCALGVPLDTEDHGEGPQHAAAQIGGVHVAVYPAETGSGARAPRWRAAASDFPGFYVDSLDEAVAAVQERGARLLVDHQERPWGCRVVAEDPDGRAVEVNQRGHCRAEASAAPGRQGAMSASMTDIRPAGSVVPGDRTEGS